MVKASQTILNRSCGSSAEVEYEGVDEGAASMRIGKLESTEMIDICRGYHTKGKQSSQHSAK